MSETIVTAIQGLQCAVCEQWKGSRHMTAVDVDDACALHVCDFCLGEHSGPGKFEGLGDDLAFALAIYAVGPEDYADHWLTDENQGAAYVIGPRIWREDDRGFVYVDTFPDHERAMSELNSWEDDGFGADQYDAWISSERNGYSVSFDSKYIGTYPRLNRARAKVSLLMRETGYYPNVFLSGEHGPSVRRIEVW